MTVKRRRRPHSEEGRENIRHGVEKFYKSAAGEARRQELAGVLPLLGVRHQFKKGNTPTNKGKTGLCSHTAEARERCGEVNKKAIRQLTEAGELVKAWSSIKDACRETGLSHVAIWYALSGKRKTAGGYQWRYNEG